MQDVLIKETRRSLGLSCAVEEESMEMARLSLEKLGQRSEETLTREHFILQLHFKILLTSKRNVVDTKILVTQDCETNAAGRCNALSFNYESFVPVTCAPCTQSTVLFVAELPSSVDHNFHVRYISSSGDSYPRRDQYRPPSSRAVVYYYA